ncbi:DNA-binding protein [Streptomyces sp. 769]|nr:DNA-binding protein [Streptomyces sp. 769]
MVLSRRPVRRACHGLITAPTFRRVAPRRFSTDLDEGAPQLRAEEADFPFSVSATDVEEFILTPAAGGDEILWHLEIDWLCAGRHGTTVVDDHGQPFALYPRSSPRLGCDYEHAYDCPAPRLALESTGGTVLVGCFKGSPRGRIKPDNGGAILDFTCPNDSRAGEYYRGRFVNYTVELIHGDPRNPREAFLAVADVRPAPEAPKAL